MTEISVQDLALHPFTAFGKDWMALGAGNEQDGCNFMTIAWGHLGSIWGRENSTISLPTAVCFVRPSRYTKEFMDKEARFTICHFPAEYRKALGYIGSHSGRNGDKLAAAGLTPVFADGTAYLDEADLVLICRKLYVGELSEQGFVDKTLVDGNYSERDFHTMYIGEVIKVLKK